MTDATRYPLSWPTGWKRNVRGGLRPGKFSRFGKWLTVADGLERLATQLEMLRAKDVIVSSNVELGMRGSPLSGRPEPAPRSTSPIVCDLPPRCSTKLPIPSISSASSREGTSRP